MFGPHATYLGVPAADLADPASIAGAGAVVVGAPFDGGTSHRAGLPVRAPGHPLRPTTCPTTAVVPTSPWASTP